MGGRFRALAGAYLAYAAFYVCRNSLNSVVPALLRDGTATKLSIGAVFSAFAAAYMVSKFAGAAASDRFSSRALLASGLLAAAASNALVSYAPNNTWITAAWTLNGLAQGLGWPAVAKIITEWFPPAERGLYWSVASTSQNAGAALAPLVAGAALPWGWRSSMTLAAATGAAAAAMVPLAVPCRPLPPPMPGGAAPGAAGRSVGGSLRAHILPNVTLGLVCAANLLGILARSGVRAWAGLFLGEAGGCSDAAAWTALSLYELGGLAGSLAAGAASDRLASGRRAPVLCLFMLGAAGCALGLPSAVATAGAGLGCAGPRLPPAVAACVAALGAGAYGSLSVIGLLAIEATDPAAAGLATGVLGAVGQLGFVAAGYPLGALIEAAGWPGFHAAVVGALALGAACLAAAGTRELPRKAKRA